MEELFTVMTKWLAVNVGAKYPIPSSLVVAVLAVIFWNWFVRSVAEEKHTTSPAVQQTTVNSNCSNDEISAGGSVSSNCTASSPSEQKSTE